MTDPKVISICISWWLRTLNIQVITEVAGGLHSSSWELSVHFLSPLTDRHSGLFAFCCSFPNHLTRPPFQALNWGVWSTLNNFFWGGCESNFILLQRDRISSTIYYWFWFFETWTHYVAQDGLKLEIAFLPQHPTAGMIGVGLANCKRLAWRCLALGGACLLASRLKICKCFKRATEEQDCLCSHMKSVVTIFVLLGGEGC